MCLWYKEQEEGAGKVRPRGAQGSIELNINSSLCFGKNSQFTDSYLDLHGLKPGNCVLALREEC